MALAWRFGIGDYGGRLPDIWFIKRERSAIVQQRAVYGAPDLIVEILAEDNHAAEIAALEADYRTVGVSEIVFIVPHRLLVRVLRRNGCEYSEITLTNGEWRSEVVAGFHVPVVWLLSEPRPDEYETITALLQEHEHTNPQTKTRTRKSKTCLRIGDNHI